MGKVEKGLGRKTRELRWEGRGLMSAPEERLTCVANVCTLGLLQLLRLIPYRA